ncbi:MAG: hypothetical protein OXC68_12105 [Aestuariivita sp.]|nr:hypothetical protein [Aestuariivita sp.]
MNSLKPMRLISLPFEEFKIEVLIGYGAVLPAKKDCKLAVIGNRLIVSSNFDPMVFFATKRLEMLLYPSAFTPSEELLIIAAGDDSLNYFQVELTSPVTVPAWQIMLPINTLLVTANGTNRNI